MTKPLVHQVFYGHVDGRHDAQADSYHHMTIAAYGDRFYEGYSPTAGPAIYGRVEDTPENRVMVAALVEQLRTAEAGRDLAANDPLFADSVKKSFRKIAEDFWAANGFDVDTVFAPLNGAGKGLVTVSKDVMLPEPLPSWWTNGEG